MRQLDITRFVVREGVFVPHQHSRDEGYRDHAYAKISELVSCVVRLLSDNTSVVFYLNKQGGTRSRRLTTVFRVGAPAGGVARHCASGGTHLWRTQCSGQHLVSSTDGLANRVVSGSTDLPVGELDVPMGSANHRFVC